jgi:hypothetical protein
MKKILFVVMMSVMLMFTMIPLSASPAHAFNPDNYKAKITKISIGAPANDVNSGKKYLPVTVYFTANEDLGDNTVQFLEGYLRAKLAKGELADMIKGLGLTLMGPVKPDVPLDSNMYSWKWDNGKGEGTLKYNVPLLEKDETQTVEKSQIVADTMEVNGVKEGDEIIMQIETVLDSSIPVSGSLFSNEAKFTVQDSSKYPQDITVTEGTSKASNPLKITGKTAVVKYAKVKKKSQLLKKSRFIRTSKKGQGDMEYKIVSAKKKGKSCKKYFKIDKKTGKLRVKKGIKRGTYTLKIKVKALGNSKYKAKATTVTSKIKIK